MKTMINAFRLKNTYRVNTIIYALKKIPLVNKLLPASLYKHHGLKTFANIIGILYEIAMIFIGKSLYFLVFFALPLIFLDGEMPLSFLHIFIFLSLIGAFLNNQLFEASRDKYYGIILMRMNAKEYVLSTYIYSLIKHIIGFMIAFFFFELPIILCLSLPFMICGMKLTVSMYDLWDYQHHQHLHMSSDNSKLRITITILLLILAYVLIPFHLELPLIAVYCVVIFFILLGVFSFYYVIQFQNYTRMCKEMLGRLNGVLMMDATTMQANTYHDMIDESKQVTCHKTGFEMMNELFMKRHHKMIWRSAKRQSIVIVAVIIILLALTIFNNEIYENLQNFLNRNLPYFVFIMYLLNTTRRITQAMFINCDHCMLTYAFYREPQNLLKLFWIRLKYMMKVNLLPAFLIALGYVVILLIGNRNQLGYALIAFISILAMSLFFSTHYLVMYYLLQPYNAYTEIVNPVYNIVMGVTYFVCYCCIQIQLPIVFFGLAILLFCVIYCIVGCLLVYKMGVKTFKIHS
ncbi:MAG: hypothetical protein ACLUVC_08850 [Longibaculum sp.]